MELMEELLKDWDGESIIISFDRPSGAWIIIAIHSTRLGPATGGTRLKSYSGLREAVVDAQRLSEGMTYKWAAAGSDMGGGKGVIAVLPDMVEEARPGLLVRYGSLIQRLNGLFLTGPDLGTSVEDMDIIGGEAPEYVFGRTPTAGGAGDPAPFTALGVFSAMEVTAQHLFDDPSLAGRRIVIQGAGSVGRVLADTLCSAGADVLFTDVDPQAINYCRHELGVKYIPAEEVYEIKCDIFAPCAVGGVLNQATIQRMDCLAVVGAANNQLARSEDATFLQQHSILYAPDFVANCGGAIAITGMETRGWTKEEASVHVRQAVRENLARIYRLSKEEGINTDNAARLLADTRLNPSNP